MNGSAHGEAIMVTGAGGFIGSRIVRRLLVDGYRLVGVVRSTAAKRLVRLSTSLSHRERANLQIVHCDLHDAAAVRSIVMSIRPSMCIHAAWDIQHGAYRDDPGNDRWVHSSLHLMRSLISCNCAWIGVLGTCIEPQRNEDPACRYAAAKATLRARACKLFAERLSTKPSPLCWWRLFQPYGPGEPSERFIPSMIAAFLQGREFEVKAPNAIRDFVHVDDIADAIVASMVHRVTGVHDLGTGVPSRLSDVSKLAAEIFQTPHLLRLSSRAESSSFVADRTSLQMAAEWRSQISLRDGLTQMIDQLCDNASILI